MKILKNNNLFLLVLWVWVGWHQPAKIRICDTLHKCCTATVFCVCRRLDSGKLAHPFTPRRSGQHPCACSPQRQNRCFKSRCHVRDIPHEVKYCLNEAVKQCKAPLCHHKRPRWSLLFPSDTAGEVCPRRGRGSESHWAPPPLPSGSLQPHFRFCAKAHAPAKLGSRALPNNSPALHITLMEVQWPKCWKHKFLKTKQWCGKSAQMCSVLKPVKDSQSGKSFATLSQI